MTSHKATEQSNWPCDIKTRSKWTTLPNYSWTLRHHIKERKKGTEKLKWVFDILSNQEMTYIIKITEWATDSLMRGYSRNTPCALNLISTFLLLRTWKETPQLNWQHAMKLNRRRRQILLKAASNLAMDLVNLLHRSQEIRVIFLLVCFHLFLVKNSYYLNSLLETSIITVYINLISKNGLYQRL